MAEEKSSGNHLSKADRAKIDGIIFSYHPGNNVSERGILEKVPDPRPAAPGSISPKAPGSFFLPCRPIFTSPEQCHPQPTAPGKVENETEVKQTPPSSSGEARLQRHKDAEGKKNADLLVQVNVPDARKPKSKMTYSSAVEKIIELNSTGSLDLSDCLLEVARLRGRDSNKSLIKKELKKEGWEPQDEDSSTYVRKKDIKQKKKKEKKSPVPAAKRRKKAAAPGKKASKGGDGGSRLPVAAASQQVSSGVSSNPQGQSIHDSRCSGAEFSFCCPSPSFPCRPSLPSNQQQTFETNMMAMHAWGVLQGHLFPPQSPSAARFRCHQCGHTSCDKCCGG